MSKLSVALTAIMMLGLVLFMAPNIFALNRGKILRNVALWLAIFAGLGLVYQAIYGGKALSMKMLMPGGQQQQEASPPSGDGNTGTKGYMPPGE